MHKLPPRSTKLPVPDTLIRWRIPVPHSTQHTLEPISAPHFAHEVGGTGQFAICVRELLLIHLSSPTPVSAPPPKMSVSSP
eukprot:636500-Rhodomonas_salina.2